jgi:hypothetical protein
MAETLNISICVYRLQIPDLSTATLTHFPSHCPFECPIILLQYILALSDNGNRVAYTNTLMSNVFSFGHAQGYVTRL